MRAAGWTVGWAMIAIGTTGWCLEKPTPQTFVYKAANGLAIELDVYGGFEGKKLPTIVWIHGGALIGGRREQIRADQLQAYLDRGFVVASIDYRLAPESKLPEIVEDLLDAFSWLREKGPGQAGIDPNRMAAVGHSAGGYLALLAGTLVDPPLEGIVSYYGYGDIVGDWYSKPDPFYLQQDLVGEEEALASVGDRPLASDKDFGRDRFRFYLYCRQQGVWPHWIGGVSPKDDPDFFAPYCPVQNVTSDFPPTLLLHGDADTDVPVEQSRLMETALKEAGIPVELAIFEGAGHGFDGRGIDRDPDAKASFDRAIAFLAERLLDEGADAEASKSSSLPRANDSFEIPTQEWPFEPGPRTIRVYVHYPGGSIERVNEETGLMLSLHNWGGTHAVGTADPDLLANRYNVVAVCVDYLQSGDWKAHGKPYDFGLYQAIDALRALHCVRRSLSEEGIPFDRGRTYACGGSGGGNVALMAAKLAPRTFACVIGMSGMAKLSDDVAFGLDGGSPLNAGYSRDPGHPFHLSAAAREIRFIGHLGHARKMKELGCKTRFILVHGVDDAVCPVEEARELAANFEAAGLSTEAHFIDDRTLDGEVFVDTGHAVGNRTVILQRVGDAHLHPGSDRTARVEGECDFERGGEVRYESTGGVYAVEFGEEGPRLRFEASVVRD